MDIVVKNRVYYVIYDEVGSIVLKRKLIFKCITIVLFIEF